MTKARNITSLGVLLSIVLLISLLLPYNADTALAQQGYMTWSIVDTPSNINSITLTPSEINAIAIGSDNKTFYAVDTPNRQIHKSTDGGVTWRTELSGYLTTAGANLPAWDIAISSSDVNLVIAVTGAPPNGPTEIFISENGGSNWQNTNFPALPAGEVISCVHISAEYGDSKVDIAVGTRTGTGAGEVYVMTIPGIGNWDAQGFNPLGDVTALKFSPTYSGDNSLIVVSATAASTFLNLGIRDIAANTTTWNSSPNYPVTIIDTDYPGSSPTAAQIITADLELPSDFSGADPGQLRRYYVSTDTTAAGTQSGVYRIDDTDVFRIKPPGDNRISSIDCHGTCGNSKLIAGEVETNPATGTVDIWLCLDPVAALPTWQNPAKPPTGGGNSGYANARAIWSPNASDIYCATSSAKLATAADWPGADPDTIPGTGDETGYLFGFALDESAFSISRDNNETWNQLSLIDTEMSFLSDVAATSADPEDPDQYQVLYLASINSNPTPTYSFDSIWRSTTDLPGTSWERVLCTATASDDIILRLNWKNSNSKVIAFAARLSNDARYSPDEGQLWYSITTTNASVSITDLTLASDKIVYILDDMFVHRGTGTGAAWTWQRRVDICFNLGHTITTPLKNPEGKHETDEDWVLAGSGIEGKVAYADFSQTHIEFTRLPPVPEPGRMQVIADEKFHQNKIIYAASDANNSKIYRYTIGTSAEWEELVPPNSAFYGLVQQGNVLYGAWDNPVPTWITTNAGADRTLYSKAPVPPPPEWDSLIAGLDTDISFTREPSSLKVSTYTDTNLWAIDNRTPPAYDFANEIGCLWIYVDTFAKVGPWPTSPASGDLIPVDPVTGRAAEINLRWRQLTYAEGYELQLAKDDKFSLVITTDDITQEFLVPIDPLAPTWIIPPGVLEANHTYYWRVRASLSTTGESVRSPWSATMSFTVKAGLPVKAPHLGPALLKPTSGAKNVSRSPAFSWTPMPNTTEYEFTLAEDSALTQIITKVNVPATAYKHDSQLDWGGSYFWQVKSVKPFVSELSPTGTFSVMPRPEPAPPPPAPPTTPPWIWMIVGTYILLIFAMIGLLRITRTHVARKRSANNLEYADSKPEHVFARLKTSASMKLKRMWYLKGHPQQDINS